MSYYQGGGYKQGADQYRPSGSRNQYGNSQSSRGRSQQHESRGSHYRPGSTRGNYQGGSQGYQGNRQNRVPPQRQGGSHSVYAQTYPDTQLWMGDLDADWTEETIKNIWIQAGENPTNVKLMREKTGRSTYCFVTFATPQDVTRALQKNQTQVPGYNRFFKLNYASGGSRQDAGPNFRANQGQKFGPASNEFSVFVGDLSPEVDEPMLFSHFQKAYPGAVRQVKIMVDFTSKVSKGFGFVRFNNEESQQHALQNMTGSVLAGRPLRVGPANRNDNIDSKKVTAEAGVPSAVTLTQYHPPLGPFTDPYNTVIKIKGITTSITRDELLGHFLPFGHIVYCRVNYKESVAHIKYLFRRQAEQAMLFMYGFIINGCRVALRWGREERSDVGKVAFQPLLKSEKYYAGKKPPLLNATLPRNVVFEDLTEKEIRELKFDHKDEFPSVEDYDEAEKQRRKERDEYLESAF